MKTVFSIIAVLTCSMAIIWVNMTIWDECRETHSFLYCSATLGK